MDPVSITLMAAAAGGGIMSALGGRKTIDPNWLKQHFGAGAVNQEMLDLFNNVINSPQGVQMMTNAAEQGQQFGNDVNSAAARAGFGPGGGADSGSSIFATSAGQGAVNSLQRGVKSSIFQQVMPVAQQMVADRMQAYMADRAGTQSTQERLGGAIGNAAGTALSMYTGAKAANPSQVVAPGGSPALASALNSAASAPQTVAGRGSLAGVQSVIPSPAAGMAPYRAGSALGRFGRRMSRFGRAFGNLVSPGNPLGQAQTV